MSRYINLQEYAEPEEIYTPAEVHAEVMPDVNMAFADMLNSHNELLETIDHAHQGQSVAEVLSTVEDGLAQPGVSAGGVAAVEVAVEGLLHSIGYSKQVFSEYQKSLPAEQRRIAAVESIKEKVGDIWHRLSMFLKMVMDKIRAFFESVFNFDKIVKIRAEGLKKKAEEVLKAKGQQTKMDLDNAKMESVYTSDAFGLFAVGANKEGKLDVNMLDFTGSNPNVSDRIANVWKKVDYYVDNAQKGIDHISDLYKQFDQLKDATGEELDNALLTIGQGFFKEFNQKERIVYPLPFGRKYIEVQSAELPKDVNADTLRSAIAKIRVGTRQASDDGSASKLVVHPHVMPLTSLPGFFADIEKMVDQNAKVRKLISSIEEAHRKADEAARKMMASKTDGAYKLKQFASTVIHTRVKIELTVIREYYEMACRMHRLLLSYGAFCLRQYSKLP